MSQPAECHLCGRVLPLGGVLDGVGRPCHYVCREMEKQRTAHDAQAIARKISRGYRPKPAHSLPIESDAPV
jgi:hypothetical protein